MEPIVKKLIFFINKYDHPTILGIRTKLGTPFPTEIEDIYPPEIRKHCDDSGWLIDRTASLSKTVNFPDNISFETHCTKRGITKEEQKYIKQNIDDKHKEKASKYVEDLSEEEFKRLFPHLKKLADDIKSFFSQ